MAKVPIPPKRKLSLRPEHRKIAEVSLKSRDRINDFVKKTRNPFGEPQQLKGTDLDDLESTLRELEKQLLKRERTVQDIEASLAERERGVWETEALLKAREALIQAQEEKHSEQSEALQGTLSQAEHNALLQLKTEIEKQQNSLGEQKNIIKEREEFLDKSEKMLFEKAMDQQEQEVLIEQHMEELDARKHRLDEQEGKPPPPSEPKEVL